MVQYGICLQSILFLLQWQVTSGLVCGSRGNLALMKPAYQSSIYTDVNRSLCVASRAVDGNANPQFFGCDSCMHTLEEYQPWWMVDLLDEFYIDRVEIVNRQEHGERMKNVDIETSVERSPSLGLLQPSLCHHTVSQPGGPTVSYQCTVPRLARYVRITLQAFTWLHLCEVRVFGRHKDSSQPDSATADHQCQTHYSLTERNQVPQSEPMLITRNKSKLECGQLCDSSENCLGFAVTQYGLNDLECHLFDCVQNSTVSKENTSYFLKTVT